MAHPSARPPARPPAHRGTRPLSPDNYIPPSFLPTPFSAHDAERGTFSAHGAREKRAQGYAHWGSQAVGRTCVCVGSRQGSTPILPPDEHCRDNHALSSPTNLLSHTKSPTNLLSHTKEDQVESALGQHGRKGL